MKPASVAVVGGGVIGASVAYHLARAAGATSSFSIGRQGQAREAPAGRPAAFARSTPLRSTCGSRCSRARSSVGSRRRPAWILDTRPRGISGSPPASRSFETLRAGPGDPARRRTDRGAGRRQGRHCGDQSGAEAGGRGWRGLLPDRRLRPTTRICWRDTSPRRDVSACGWSGASRRRASRFERTETISAVRTSEGRIGVAAVVNAAGPWAARSRPTGRAWTCR